MHAATQTAAHWLDIMPATLDLVDGLPVRVGPDYERWDHSGTILGADCSPLEMRDGYGDTQIIERGDVRIDLDAPLGFDYALRGFYQAALAGEVRPYIVVDAAARLAVSLNVDGGWFGVRIRALEGETTDADRLALAYALAEVQA